MIPIKSPRNLLRRTTLVLAALIPLAGLGGVGQVHAQEAVQVTSVSATDLRGRALRAIRDGDFEQGATLLKQAATLSSDAELQRLDRWTEEFSSQRSVLVDERRKQFEEAKADLAKLVTAHKDEAAIDFATRAHVLAEDKAAFTNEPITRELISRVTTLAAAAEERQQWVKAIRLYADLAQVEPNEPLWREKLKSVARANRLLQFYAPERLRDLMTDDAKAVDEIQAILRPELPPASRPSEDPSTRPIDLRFQLSWREELRGIKPDMFWGALIDVRSNYWRDVNFTKLMTTGLSGVRALLTTDGLEVSFPALADAQKKAALAAVLDNLDAKLKASSNGTEVLTASKAYKDLFDATRSILQLPDEVVVYEFSDAALSSLDPFSSMLWPAQWEEFNKRTQGEFSGVGIQIQNDDDGSLKVISPIEDSPAFKAGIKAGDIITHVDGKPMKGITTTQAVRIITGAIGTPVNLTIRSSDGTSRDHRLIRNTIRVASLRGFMFKPGGGWDYFIDSDQRIAYVRLTDFTRTSAEELDKVAAELKAQGARGIIFDMRGNPGGLLTAAIDVANKFLTGGVIVSTRADRPTPQQQTTATARPDPDEVTLPMVILVNQQSASAAEIVSGALKDLGRATVVGERTYGKGSVQLPFDVGTRNAFLKLTISHYYLPSGRSLHRDEDSKTWGVEPDVKVEMTPEQMVTAQLARMQFDVLRQTGEVPPEPTTRPGAISRPVVRTPEDLIKRDSQLGAALLLMRLQLNNAEVAASGTPRNPG